MNGALIIDKPEGITSHDVVARVRRAMGVRKVGHAGTLDPFATGVLVLCLGPSTRLIQFLVGLDKEYVATVRLGFATDTQDLTGKQMTPLRSSKGLSLEDVTSVLKDFVGPQSQVPPMYSAKKVEGERLYQAARAGRVVEREPISININSIDLISQENSFFTDNEDGTRDFVVRVSCSSGTYIRTLAHDLGERLGVGAHLSALRRSRVGKFDLSRSLRLDTLEEMVSRAGIEDSIISPAQTLAHLPAIGVDRQQALLISNGRAIDAGEIGPGLKQQVRLLDGAGELLAVGEFGDGDRLIRPRVVLSPSSQ